MMRRPADFKGDLLTLTAELLAKLVTGWRAELKVAEYVELIEKAEGLLAVMASATKNTPSATKNTSAHLPPVGLTE